MVSPTPATRAPLTLTVAAAIALAALPAAAQSPEVATTPEAKFQYSSITGTNSVINVTRVPVTSSTGIVTYYDMTLTFDVGSGGVPRLGNASITKSLGLKISTFKAGTYFASTDRSFSVLVTGPGIAEGGTTAWTLSSATQVCGLPSTGDWYVGPISLNPYAARIEAAKITTTDFSYGIVGTPSPGCNPFASGYLIGASQVGNTLSIATFTAGNGIDGNLPAAVTTFILSQ